jgi:TPR repeat protein
MPFRFKEKLMLRIGKLFYKLGFLETAGRYLVKAAESDVRDAQLGLALMHWRGEGFPQSDVKAIGWFKLAAQQGDPVAQAYLGFCAQIGRGLRQSHSDAIAWYSLAVEQGNPMAQHNLALIYENGTGVAKDKNKAFRLFQQAAEQGVDEAKDYLENANAVESETIVMKYQDNGSKHQSSELKRPRKSGGGLKDFLSIPTIFAVMMILFYSDTRYPVWILVCISLTAIYAYGWTYNALFGVDNSTNGIYKIVLKGLFLVGAQVIFWAALIGFVSH